VLQFVGENSMQVIKSVTEDFNPQDCCAYMYTSHVDKKPTDETRTAVDPDPYYAYMYIDKKQIYEARIAACNDS
jgi:hypothetical protein